MTAQPRTGRTLVEPRKRGRPRVHAEQWSKVSVVLFDRQLKRLDRLKRTLGPHSKGLNRAAIIRAVLDAALDCYPTGFSVSSEADLRKLLAKKFSR